MVNPERVPQMSAEKAEAFRKAVKAGQVITAENGVVRWPVITPPEAFGPVLKDRQQQATQAADPEHQQEQ